MTTPQSNQDKIIAIEAYIVKHGLRLTRLRRIILDILIKQETHLSVAQIHLLACDNTYDFAVASVYRNINTLVVIGVVESHQFKKGQATYELAGKKPHAHLIDLESGQVIEFRHAALDLLKAEIAKTYGYRTEDCHIELYAHPMENSSTAALRNNQSAARNSG